MRALICGYYGFGNAGDEAVLAGLLEAFGERGVDVGGIAVLSANPPGTTALHGVRAIDRMRLRAVASALRGSDVLVLGGGSLLQDVTSVRSVVYYVSIARLSRLLGVPVAFIAQGVGPLRRRATRALVGRAADRARRVTVRDEESAGLLRQLGVRKPPISVTADLAFALTPAPRAEAQRVLASAGVPGCARTVGLSVRPWRGMRATVEDPPEWARTLAGEVDACVALLAMQPAVDTDVCRSVARVAGGRAYVLSEPMPPRLLLAVMGELRCVVGMRLHALIMAAARAVPPVAVSYDPKVSALMRGLGYPQHLVTLADASGVRVLRSVNECLDSYEHVAADLRCKVRTLRDRAVENVDHIVAAAGRT